MISTFQKEFQMKILSHFAKHFKYQSKSRGNLKVLLDELVKFFADWMMKDKQGQSKRSNARRLKTALKKIKEAAEQIDGLDPSGRLALEAIAPFVSEILAARWVRETFANAPFSPARSRLTSRTEHLRAEPNLGQLYEFVRHRPLETMSALIRQTLKALDAARIAARSSKGRQRGTKAPDYRHFLIINLAEIACSHGLKVSTGLKSDFVTFCEVVAQSIGWPTDGMSSAIPDAVTDWFNRRGIARSVKRTLFLQAAQ